MEGVFKTMVSVYLTFVSVCVPEIQVLASFNVTPIPKSHMEKQQLATWEVQAGAVQ